MSCEEASRVNIIFFSPQFPPSNIHFCTSLAKLDCNVLGIADASDADLCPQLKTALTDYYHVKDINDYDQVKEAVAYFTRKFGKIDCFESHNEYWLEQDARIRTEFNIDGIKTDVISKIKQKSLMKSQFINAGVAVAPGIVSPSLEEAEVFIHNVGYPVIAKPDNGVGAANTSKISSHDELIRFFQEKQPADYLLEGFIDGKLYSFDGLTDREGKPAFYTAHYFGQGIMDIVNQDLDIAYYSLREIPPALEDAGLRTVAAFNLRERFFHIEFFINDMGKVVALEINMRPPGGLTMDMFNYANDIDLYYQWGNIVVNNRFDAVYNRKYNCAYIGRKSNKLYLYDHQQILDRFGAMIVQHEPVDGLFSGALGNYGYVARASDLAHITEIIDYIHAKRQ